jgi:RNA recognition motif-containing protein
LHPIKEERRYVSKVFVGNLSFDTTREELEALFAPMGDIAEVFVPLDRASGRPRGFAFVTFAAAEGAAQAIEKLNGAELGGRNLRVDEATTERSSRPAGGGYSRGFGGGGGGRPAPPSRPKGSRRNIRGRKRSIW